MKKLITILGSLMLTSTATATVVSCNMNSSDNDKITPINLSEIMIGPENANLYYQNNRDLIFYAQQTIDILNNMNKFTGDNRLIYNRDLTVRFYADIDRNTRITDAADLKPSASKATNNVYVEFLKIPGTKHVIGTVSSLQMFRVYSHPSDIQYANELEKYFSNKNKIQIVKEDNAILTNNIVISELTQLIPSTVNNLFPGWDTDDYLNKDVSFGIVSNPAIPNEGYAIGEQVEFMVKYKGAQSSYNVKLAVTAPERKDATNQEFQDAIVKILQSKLYLYFDQSGKLTQSDVEKQIRSLIPNSGGEIKIPNRSTDNYQKGLLHFTVSAPSSSDNYSDKETVDIQVWYSNSSAPLNPSTFTKTVHSNAADIYSKKFTDLDTSTLVIKKPADQITQDVVIKELFSRTGLPHSYQIISSASTDHSFTPIAQNGNKPLSGTYAFTVFDPSLGQSGYLINQKDHGTMFVVYFSNQVVSEMNEMFNALKNVDADGNNYGAINLQDIKIIDFLPKETIKYIPPELHQYLAVSSLGDVIKEFLDPYVGVAKYLPNHMPILDKNGNIDFTDPENEGIQKFISEGLGHLNNHGLHVDDYTWHFNDVYDNDSKRYLGAQGDLKNALINLIPDFIHFHQYLLKQTMGGTKVNYVLNLIKYFLTPKQDINNDGFSQINPSQAKYIHNNFDNFLSDILEQFQDKNKVYYLGKDGKFWYGVAWDTLFPKSDGSYKQLTIANFVDPIKNLVLDPFNKLIGKNPDGTIGQNILEPVTLSALLDVLFIKQVKSITFPLMGLHLEEIKDLILKNTSLLSLDDYDIEITSGHFTLVGQKDSGAPFVITDLSDLINVGGITHLKAIIKGMSFTIKSKTEHFSIQKEHFDLQMTF